MWCVPKLDAQYIERMEDVLELYARPLRSAEPVVCFDERPVQLLEWVRPASPVRPGREARQDYAYFRCGTANLFCAVEPKAGWHLVKATPNRKSEAFAEALQDVAKHYPGAETIHLVLDNLSTHSCRALEVRYGVRAGRRLWRRFSLHYTPVHGSWLNQAEVEISLVSRQCLGNRRIPTLDKLDQETDAWEKWANRQRLRIRWRFTVPKARARFGYDPPSFSRSEDYGATALPARVRHPDRKGKVESAVGHAQRTPLKGLRFESLEAAQAYLDAWEAKWADTRIHGTTKRQVAAMFSEERPRLLSLPVEPFRYYAYGERVVHLDGHVEVDGAYYSVPPGHIGRKLHVQWDSLHVRLLLPASGQLLREHTRAPRGHHRTREEDRPSHAPRTTVQLLERAARAGRGVAALCAEVHRREGETGTRRILGVLSLAKKHGAAALDDACEVALEVGVPSYRFVRRYLERRTPTPVTLRQVDPLIRELTHYRDVIARLTQPTPHPGDTET
ncbi:IS630 family transposase [Myxococcus llanfairpwllgwyngyllgogerychwyrndrobwllllantysiliogogogochensis]|uniref:IS630 family transposase n=1 Tax=Myxococcus llanfairpwllgwyngyllgogerychwyrndrobwllllantysiliogogogochensis TaxID=2590453 RepID=A0A540X0C3_9BACT|nr:IS630 family transposase [Myxococcus llanfairpwllgwyngyllgogerychwyrndrobwllllantysiliogogogochensis]